MPIPDPDRDLFERVHALIKRKHVQPYVDLRVHADHVLGEIMDEDTGTLLVGQHNSLEETVLLPFAIYEQTAQRGKPRILQSVYGSNLNTFGVKQLLERTGNIPIQRSQGKPLLHMKQVLYEGLREHRNLSIYPEGTRSRTGKPQRWAPTPFQAAIEAGLESRVAVLPFNVSFSYIPEERDFVENPHGSGGSVPLHELPQWIYPRKPLGLTDVRFGEPLEVSGNEDRKQLAVQAQRQAANAVSILPVNVAAEAMRRAYREQPLFSDAKLRRHVDETIDKLMPYVSQFTHPLDVDVVIKESRLTGDEDPRVWDLYAGHIDHYLHPDEYPDIMQENAPFGI